jgi:hypothetical protein
MIPNVLLFCISSETFEEEKEKVNCIYFFVNPLRQKENPHRPRWFNLQKMSNQIIPSDWSKG